MKIKKKGLENFLGFFLAGVISDARATVRETKQRGRERFVKAGRRRKIFIPYAVIFVVFFTLPTVSLPSFIDRQTGIASRLRLPSASCQTPFRIPSNQKGGLKALSLSRGKGTIEPIVDRPIPESVFRFPRQILMGCTASRDYSIQSTASAGIIPRALSLPTPLVHHLPLRRGDSHHLVSLTSSTYGSLDIEPVPDDSPAVPAKALDRIEATSAAEPHVIDAWELMADLDDSSPKKQVQTVQRSYTFQPRRDFQNADSSVEEFGKKGNGRFGCSERLRGFKRMCDSETQLPNYSMPLWKHLTEEKLLADLDPSVASTLRRTVSSRQCNNYSFQSKPISTCSPPPNPSKTNAAPTTVKVSPFESKAELPGTENRIVLYFTSLRGIRRTYEDCCAVRTIFAGFRVPVDERDISMDSTYRKELQSVLGQKTVSLPQVFIRGKHIGGAEEMKQLHETGELAKLLQGFPVRRPGFACESCADVRFVPCPNCNGSRKIFIEEEGQLRRCPECNENGLVRCPYCCC
ncbi:hypothetical protein H6P81_015022 [Aristolochia fimbriata]|uniref:Glutaredoxin domain-containing protein n=1 Tax=Aristolochia fimbriata TaxID=158543 RepID=A0AAV7E854_ARIFI|nr:hypothetical protein H6P81_015022 [Aristolochia fimbriata]